MKKIFLIVCICFFTIVLTSNCLGAEFQNPPVVDDAGYLSEDQMEDLTQKLEGIRQRYNFEVAIVTEYDMSGYDAMSTADDIYDYEGYGSGENDDGILLYICSSNREYWITTHARGLEVFNENGIAYLKKNIEEHLENDEYYLAMDTFADLSDELLDMAENGEPFNETQYDMQFVLIVLGCGLALPLIIAFALMKRKLSKMKTAVANDYAANYVKPGSKHLTTSRDIFLYSHITKTEKPKNNSGSHTSSSGRTHGGGGGSF